MWRYFSSAAVMLTCAIVVGPTRAAPIEFPFTATFEDVIAPGNPVVTSLAAGPLVFSSDYFHTIANPQGGLLEFVENETVFIAEEGGGLGMPITLAMDDGSPFALVSLDAAEGFLDAAAAAAEGFAPSTFIDLTATTPGGGELSISLPLDGQKDGPGPLADFQTFTLPPEFGIITSVTFSGSCDGGADGAIALDNIAVGVPIPEPTSLLLLVIGAAGIGTRRTRRFA